MLQPECQHLQEPRVCVCTRQNLHWVSHVLTTYVRVILCVGVLNVRGRGLHLCTGLNGSGDNSSLSYIDSLNMNSLCTRLKENSSKTMLSRLLRQVGNVRRATFHPAHTWLTLPLSEGDTATLSVVS